MWKVCLYFVTGHTNPLPTSGFNMIIVAHNETRNAKRTFVIDGSEVFKQKDMTRVKVGGVGFSLKNISTLSLVTINKY